MKERGRYNYSNSVDRVEFDYDRPADDLDRITELEQMLRED
jgi:hypothetical protein